MLNWKSPRVLMVGPDRSLCGGVVSVINGYFEAGIQQHVSIRYLGTGVGKNLFSKCFAFLVALIKYRYDLKSCDVVHFHVSARGSFRRKALMARIARKRGKRIILHEHSGEFARDFEAKGPAYQHDVRKAFGLADKVLVLSEEWRNYFAENVCDLSKIVVLHNAVTIPDTPCSPGSQKNILFLGRLDENKSPDLLLRAAKDLVALFPEMKLYFAGDGDVEQFRGLASDLGVLENCKFCGWISGDEKDRLFSEAALLCLPSKHEGMPMSIIEAMARGIPVIATPVGGIPELIEDGVEGKLVPVGDERALSNALIELLSSSQTRALLGNAARNKAKTQFNINNCILQLVALYQEVCESEQNE